MGLITVNFEQKQECMCMAHQVMPWLYEHFPMTHAPAQTVVIGAGDGEMGAAYLGFYHLSVSARFCHSRTGFTWPQATL
jgi:enterochelin esterase-like enzyme